MRRTLILVFLAISPCAFAQEGANTPPPTPPPPPAVVAGAVITARRVSSAPPVLGTPYSATVTNEFVQTLADGNRIVQSSTGTIARDSEGRTRQDAPLPIIAGLTPANAPHLVFIQDPVAQVSYTLNLTAKTAQKISMGTAAPPPPGAGQVAGAVPGPANAFFVQMKDSAGAPPLPPLGPALAIQAAVSDRQGAATTEDLGSQTMEGVFVTGTRTTRTIPAGQIGNDKPISIVTEVWTSPDLKAIVYSKRSDPRLGEQTFKLTNISRSEPDPSLFTVPAGFTVSDGPQPVMFYRSPKE